MQRLEWRVKQITYCDVCGKQIEALNLSSVRFGGKVYHAHIDVFNDESEFTCKSTLVLDLTVNGKTFTPAEPKPSEHIEYKVYEGN